MVDFRLLYMFDYQRVGLRTHREFTRHPRLRFGNKPAKIHQTNPTISNHIVVPNMFISSIWCHWFNYLPVYLFCYNSQYPQQGYSNKI